MQLSTWLNKLPRVRVVLEHPQQPEDARLLHLFRNRFALKKALGDSQDEQHRLKDRVKLQEAATARVREQLEQLEARLAVPMSGLHTLLHYQLRDLWATGHARVATLVRELAAQREERERRQFLADLNRQIFDRQQSARAECAQAEHAAADVRIKLANLQAALGAAQSWWQYFKRRDLERRVAAMQAEMHAAEGQLERARERLMRLEEQGGARYPGLSLQSRRVLNLSAIGMAHLLAQRLAPPTLLARVIEAMARSEPRMEGVNDAAGSLALMQEIGRAKGAMTQNGANLNAELRPLIDSLAAGVKYRLPLDTVPTAESLLAVLRGSLPKPEAMTWDVLGQDLWGLSDLFFPEGETV